MNRFVAMTGSIVHEIKQPAAIVANAKAGLRWLERTNPDVDETRAVLQAIVCNGHCVDGVRVQLQQVTFNLITNAVDAMDTIIDRARSLRVTSELKSSDGVVVKIADIDTGIALENIDRIFDTFFTAKSHGMGMGFAFAARLLNLAVERCRCCRGTRMEQSSSYFAGWPVGR
jgi:signal transduction histidine kinase